MMKRAVYAILLCAAVLSFTSFAAAQSVPEPVTRMGDFIEISDDVFMNLIFTTQWVYVTNTDNDFESDVRDEPSSSNSDATSYQTGDCDCLYDETRFGADLRYKKNMRVRILFEHQSLMDGNRIDNGFSVADDEEGRQRNTVNLERAYIEYKFPIGVTMTVGARLWTTDAAGVLGDDDPRFHVSWKSGNLSLQAAAVIQTEGLRNGFENDNDNVYYTFGGDYNLKPWQFGLHGAYFRWRNPHHTGSLALDGPNGVRGQKHDSVLLMPYIKGKVNILSFLFQPMFIFGEAERTDAAVAAGQDRDVDIAAWGIIGQVEADLGKIRPFFAFAIGSGDDDVNDNDLNGFAPLPQREITLTTTRREFSVLTRSPSWGSRDWGKPARTGALDVSNEFLHSVGNPFNDRIGSDNTLITGLSTTYSNPGTLTLIPGIKIFPWKGHELDLYYAYRGVLESEPIEAQLAAGGAGVVSVDESILHEFSAMYTWTVNKHFDIRATGNLAVLADGGQDVAETQTTCGDGTQACEGEDVALRGELRFRARF